MDALLRSLLFLSCTCFTFSLHPLYNKRCALKPTMSIDHCVHHGATADDAIGILRRKESNTDKEESGNDETKGGNPLVDSGTTCLADPFSGNLQVLKCRYGAWSKTTGDTSTNSINQHALVRPKRWGSIRRAWRTIRCCWKKIWGQNVKCCRSCPKVYQPPTISCPNIPSLNAEKYTDKVRVNWVKATGSDPDGPAPTITQTQGPAPNSLLAEGAYTVTYLARDSQGRTATCSRSFSVSIIRCSTDMMLTPTSGSASCSHGNLYGSVCRYSCNTNYELVTASSVECLANGRWSDEIEPSCEEIQCSRPNSISRGSWSSCSSLTSVGDQCTLTCDPGYIVDGTAEVTCLNSRLWTSAGLCRDTESPEFTCPGSVSVYSEPKMQPKQLFWISPSATDNSGETVTVTSDYTSGHLFPVGVTSVTFSSSDNAGNTHSCRMSVEVKVKYCSPLPPVDHGSLNCSHTSAVGSDCDLNCYPGFDLAGVNLRMCLSDTTWSDSQPFCQRASCGRQSLVPSGSLNCSGNNYEDVCSLTCDAGFQTSGPLISTCQVSLQWSSLGSCLDVEPPTLSGCSNVVRYAERLGQDTQVIYTLPQANDNSGETIIVTGIPASGSSFPIGLTNVSVSASDSSGNNALCVLSVNVIEIQCADPQNTDLDESSDRRMEFSCQNGYSYGAECQLSCSDGNPVQGGNSIACEKNGTEIGYWFYGNVKPYCDDQACPAIQPPDHGAVACDVVADTQVCTLQCQENYAYPVLANQDGFFVCSRSQWQPVQNIQTDICIAGRQPRGAQLMADIFYYSGDCSFNNTVIKQNFIAIINDSSILSGYCSSQNVICNLETVNITCGVDRKKRSVDTAFQHDIVKRSTNYVTKAIFTISVKPKPNETFSKSIVETVIQGINDRYYENTLNGKYDMTDVGSTDQWSFGNGVPTYDCPDFTYHQGRSSELICVGCGKGYIYGQDQEFCTICPRGSYQPRTEADTCLPCPNNATTKGEGADSLDLCLEICRKGEYSAYGYAPCDQCPRGSYQELTMGTSCLPCPYGMSTPTGGSSSASDCIYYDIQISPDVEGPIITDWSLRSNPSDISIVAFIKVPSDLNNTSTIFSLTPSQNNGNAMVTASFGCNAFNVYMTTQVDVSKREKRQWHHVSLIFKNDTFSLYVDGSLAEQDQRIFQATPVQMTGRRRLLMDRSLAWVDTWSCDQIVSSISDANWGLVISELQTVKRALTPSEVTRISTMCGTRLDGNILTLNNIVPTLTTASTCDSIDACQSQPCGNHGICTDLKEGSSCECDFPYIGDSCQDQISFCDDNQCNNGANCTNNYVVNNYTCVCTEDFRGTLCNEEIVHGGFSPWSEWSPCSSLCGPGNVTRGRRCDSPTPGPGGRGCAGALWEEQACDLAPCPVHGGISAWEDVWSCPVTCGNGTEHRSRHCDSPEPLHGGRGCYEPLIEYRECTGLIPCPVNGGPGFWSAWPDCTVSCAGGTRVRVRSCDNPPPQHGGTDCEGRDLVEEEPCNLHECPTCPALRRQTNSYHSGRPQCVTNTTTDMQECSIGCQQGYMTRDANFTCGSLTNYIWSHATPSNPEALLPVCTKAEIASRRSFSSSASIDTPDPQATRVAILDNVGNLTSCTGTCTLNVGYTTVSRKRSTGSTFTIDIVVTSPNGNIDTATVSGTVLQQEIDSMNEFETNIDSLLTNTLDVFTVSLNGHVYSPDESNIVSSLEIACPDGTELLDNFCAECPKGYYSENNVCQVCAVGQYQDLTRQVSCNSCPDGTTTVWYGAQSLSDCSLTGGQTSAGDDGLPMYASVLVGLCVITCVAIAVFALFKKIHHMNGKKNMVGSQISLQKRHNEPEAYMNPLNNLPPPYTRQPPVHHLAPTEERKQSISGIGLVLDDNSFFNH